MAVGSLLVVTGLQGRLRERELMKALAQRLCVSYFAMSRYFVRGHALARQFIDHTIKRFFKIVAVCFLALGIGVASSIPAQALTPAVFLTPAIATTTIAEVGVVASAVSGIGELAIAGYGAYLAWTQLSHYFTVKVPYHAGSLADPVSRPSQNTVISDGSTLHYFKSANGVYSSWTYQTVSFVSASFTDSASHAVVLASPRFTSQGGDYGSGYTNMICGISVKNVSTGVITTDLAGAQFFPSGSAPFVANMNAVQVPACDTEIQTALTQSGVDGTTKVAVGVQVYLSPATGYGSTGIIYQSDPSLMATMDLGHVSFGSLTSTLQGTTVCKNAGGTVLTIAGSVMNMPNSGNSSVELKGCPVGYYVFDSKIIQTDGITPSVPFEIGQKASTVTSFPLCAGVAQCQLQVYYKTIPCTNAVGQCTDWYKDAILAPTDYQCYWGTYLLTGLGECAPLVYQYDPLATIGADGLAVSSPQLSPPTTSTTTVTNDTTQSGTSTATDNGFTGCAPSGWNMLNPFAFVGMQGCLAKWLFIPSGTVLQDATTSVKTAWDSSAVGTFTTAMIGIPSALIPLAGNGSANCQGPGFSLHVGTITPSMIYPMNACAAPMSTVAGTVKILSGIFIAFEGVVVVWNTFASAFNLTRINFKPESWQQDSMF